MEGHSCDVIQEPQGSTLSSTPYARTFLPKWSVNHENMHAFSLGCKTGIVETVVID